MADSVTDAGETMELRISKSLLLELIADGMESRLGIAKEIVGMTEQSDNVFALILKADTI